MSKDTYISASFGPDQTTRTCSTCHILIKEDKCPEHPTAPIDFDSISELHVRTLPIQLNPLVFLDAVPFLSKSRDRRNEGKSSVPSPEQILKYICGNSSSSGEKILKRYSDCKLSSVDFLPAERFFTEKLLEPLREAQSNFMIGNWLASITLAGITCELITMLFFESVKDVLIIHGKSLQDLKIQKVVFGMEFKKLPQEAKLKLLVELNVISKQEFDYLERVRSIRNSYVHYYDYNPDEKNKKKQAIEALEATSFVIRSMLIEDLSGGKITLKANIERYLIKIGALTPIKSSVK